MRITTHPWGIWIGEWGIVAMQYGIVVVRGLSARVIPWPWTRKLFEKE